MIVTTRPLGACAVALLLLTVSAAVSSGQFYFSDFEGTDGGWVAGGAGDWARGVPMTYDPTGTSGAGGIPNAFSGNELWATVLDGAHNNQSPSASSTLTQTFDFSSLAAPITLSWQHYLQSGSNAFDMARVFANGTEVYLGDGTEGSYDAGSNTVTFAPAMADLSAFAGVSSVEINFDFFATTVVQRDGWYVDDITITAVPEPATFGLIGCCGLALLRLRHRSWFK